MTPSSLLRILLIAATATTPTLAQSTSIHPPTKPIPPFTLWQLRPNATAEAQVTSTTLNPQGHWLLVYLDLKSPATQTLLTQLQSLTVTPPTGTQPESLPALDPTKLVLVAATATGAELTQFALKFPGLATAAWTHDVHSQAAQILSIQGSPHLLGMIENHQRWQYSGTLNPTDLKPTVLTWLARNTLPPNKLTRTQLPKPQLTPKPIPPPTNQ